MDKNPLNKTKLHIPDMIWHPLPHHVTLSLHISLDYDHSKHI